MKLERKIPMSFSGWVVSMNAAVASREAIVPCNIYAVQKRAHGLKLQIPLTSCLVSVSTSPAALTWTWTVTATRRTTMTGTVREPRRLLTFACVSVQEVDSSSPLAPTPHPPTRVCCLLHSCQAPKSEELNHDVNATQQHLLGNLYTHCYKLVDYSWGAIITEK